MRLRRYTLRGHRHPAAGREAQIAHLLARVLRAYRFSMEEHGACDSCLTDVEIFERKARDLGVDLTQRSPALHGNQHWKERA